MGAEPSKRKMDQNGPISDQEWSLFTATGDLLNLGCELGNIMFSIDYFLLIFIPQTLQND